MGVDEVPPYPHMLTPVTAVGQVKDRGGGSLHVQIKQSQHATTHSFASNDQIL